MMEIIKNIPVILWVYYGFLLVVMLIALIFLFKEKINEKYIKFFYPESIIKIFIHYPSGLYKKIYRIIQNQLYFKKKHSKINK